MAISVLVVEDDDILAENIQMYLKRSNWDVRVCHSAEDPLRALETVRPDIVITDHILPGITGLELLQRVMAMDPQIKVIMMTGESTVQTAVDAMKAGAYVYLTKPVVLAQLKILLEKALGVSSMERALSFYQRNHRPSGYEEDRGGRPCQRRDRPLHEARPVPVDAEDAHGLAALHIDYLGRYAVVAALDGPDKSRGAPIYLLEDGRLVSTIFPKDDLGLVNFEHVHNAVLREAGGRLYIIAQAWNPGDFGVLEQVVP